MYSPTSARLCTLLGLSSLSQGLLLDPATLQQNLLSSYDYVIVGAGPAGLVVANRLTEDENINVLVLEAGPMDSREAGVTFPSNIGAEVGSRYDWNLTTVAQTSLDGATRSLSQGHAVAGGTILNGMIWTRGTQADYDAWETLGNDGWGWDDMVPYFQRVEGFTNNVADSVGHEVAISPDSSIYGQSGPVQVGYSEYFYSQFNNFLDGNMELGLELVNDTSGGTNVGVTVPPSSLSATNQSRSDARAAYLDTAIDRTNLHIAPEQRVTNLILSQGDGSSDPIAEGVHFVSASDSSQVLSINATREVILSAGAVWTPALLQVSGIGPSAVLEGLGIDVIADLPGVGNNLQDHGMVDPYYDYSNADIFTASDVTGATLEAAEEEYYANRTGPLTATLIEAIAYLPLSSLSSSYEALISNLSAADPDTYLPSDYPDEVRIGYAAQYAALIQQLGSDTEGAVEMMSNSIGTIQVASQRPFSRGYVRPASASILDGVEIDPRYCANPFDKDIVVMGLEWNARLIQTSAMQELTPSPEAALTSGDESQLEAFVNSGLGTEFHPCGTTAMMPLESGGVVDTELKVYGVQNLRSVSSAIIPLIPSAHLQAVTYALAEKAADMIIAAQANSTSADTSTASSASTVPSSTSTSASSSTATVADVSTTAVSIATTDATSPTSTANEETATATGAGETETVSPTATITATTTAVTEAVSPTATAGDATTTEAASPTSTANEETATATGAGETETVSPTATTTATTTAVTEAVSPTATAGDATTTEAASPTATVATTTTTAGEASATGVSTTGTTTALGAIVTGLIGDLTGGDGSLTNLAGGGSEKLTGDSGSESGDSVGDSTSSATSTSTTGKSSAATSKPKCRSRRSRA